MDTIRFIIAFLLTVVIIVPASADENCAAWCGDGKVWDEIKGECVVVQPNTGWGRLP